MNFGLASVDIMLINLLHHFHWEFRKGVDNNNIDMTEVFSFFR
jgi:hypothetical protein